MLDIYRGDISNGARFNMCTVIRNIYPIGQGGFASEYHVDNDKTIYMIVVLFHITYDLYFMS